LLIERFTIKVFTFFPLEKCKVVFTNYYGKGFGDNGKYIAQELLKRNRQFDIVWLLAKNENSEFPPGIRTVTYGGLRALFELCTAGFWIDNCRKPGHYQKRLNQIYIQTWHGGVALKQIEKDAEKVLSRDYLNNAKNDSIMADFILSNSEFFTELVKRAFWFSGRIIQIGSPRCDILIGDKKAARMMILEKFGLSQDSKIVLYLPTFRADYSADSYNIEPKKLKEVLSEKYGGVWHLFVRLHPNIINTQQFLDFNWDSSTHNITNYPDVYEIMAGSDVLITDYSSLMFEFAMLKKPVFLYCNDIMRYKYDRGFYFSLDELPFKVSESQSELNSNIMGFKENEYLCKIEAFFKRLKLCENGTASEEVVNLITGTLE
jgi:CDP-glycerol glycerophosphotransferase